MTNPAPRNHCWHCGKPVTIPGRNWTPMMRTVAGVVPSWHHVITEAKIYGYAHIVCPSREGGGDGDRVRS